MFTTLYFSREEHRQQAKIVVKRIKKDEDKPNKAKENDQNNSEHTEEEIPPSIAILFSGHEFLGKDFSVIADNILTHIFR